MNRTTRILLLIATLGTTGCEALTARTSPMDPEARQDAILADPMGADLTPPSVGGSGFMDHLGEFIDGH